MEQEEVQQGLELSDKLLTILGDVSLSDAIRWLKIRRRELSGDFGEETENVPEP